MTPTAQQIGLVLRAWREGAGMAREKCAAQIGVTMRTLGRWEKGEAAPPTDKFFALVELYHADVGMLFANGRQRPRRYPLRPVNPSIEGAGRAAPKGATKK
jgi:transcriptional regulator with XRE-family HTH domain